MNTEDLLDVFRDMTLADLGAFRKAFEDEFDVTAALPVLTQGVDGSQGANGSAVEEEQTEFTVRLDAVGSAKIQVIKEVRRLVPGLGLAESKALVDSAPVAILKDVPRTSAEDACEALRAAGATVVME